MSPVRLTLYVTVIVLGVATGSVLMMVGFEGWSYWLFALPIVAALGAAFADLDTTMDRAGCGDPLLELCRWLRSLRSGHRLTDKFDLPGKAEFQAYRDSERMIRAVYDDALGFNQNVEISFDQLVDGDTVRINLRGKTLIWQAAISLVRERIATMKGHLGG